MALAELEPAAALDCAHCGLPAPAAREDERPFCCGGCRAAWALIHDSGLAGYYALPERRETPVKPSGRAFEEFDHAAFHRLYVRPRPGELLQTEFYLEGVHCASCVWLVERVPLVLPGLASAELDVRRSLVRLVWDPAVTRLSEVARALDRLGYRPLPFRGAELDEARRREDRSAIAAIGIAGALAINVMVLALALYSGWFSGMEGSYRRYFRWLSLALTIPTLLGPGRVFFRSAFAALRARTLHMDVPIALALAAGALRGAWNTVADRGPIYFDGVAALVFLLLAGRFLQRRAQRAATDSAELLHGLSPSVARVIEGSATREVPVEALLPGMCLEVRAGETIPADGRVTAGRSSLDLSLLTGESRPAAVGAGEAVFAGTLNLATTLQVQIERSGEETRLGRLLRSIEEGARRRAPIVRLADQLAGRFVAVVLGVAAATWVFWLPRDASAALDHAIALLIVTCPCALALATPLAVTAAIGRAAREGILIKGGDALERLARPGLILLDKTGTLTEGRTALERWDGGDALRPAVLALERHATHPVAEGFRAAWPEVEPRNASDVRVTLGGGVEGMVDGRLVLVGSPGFVASRATAARPPATEGTARLTPVWVAVDGHVVARAGFADPIRPEAARVLATLRERGWRPRLLSGDDPAVAAEVGRALGFAPEDCRGGATPEDKRRAVEEASRLGPVVMVGDGVNDAAAIASASVGIGMRGGAEACLAAADVFLARPGLDPLLRLLCGSRRTLDVIRRGIAFSLVYNLAGAALAVTGVVDPLIAAILMPASSISVVLASWWGRTFQGDPR